MTVSSGKQLRIAMLGHKRVPSREGGIEVVVEELSALMVQMGHQVTCYNRGGHHVSGKEFDSGKLSEHRGIKLKTVFTVNLKGLEAIIASIMGAIRVAFGKYDVVHFHAEGPCAMLWLPKIYGKRCVATIHGLDHQRAKWGKVASTYIRLGEKCAVKYADEIIVLSIGVQRYFMEMYGRETTLIPNGVNLPAIRETNLIKKKYGLEKDDYILFLGRIVPEKGITYLIQAFKGVRTDKKLVIAGGASDTKTFMQSLKDMSIDDDRITFTGFVQGEILEELYSNAYIYCLPSDLEGMPLSLLEAMSYGNCCLVSDIEECSSVVQDKAMVFRKSDIEDLTKKLQGACNDENAVKYYKRYASDFICSKYNWNDIVLRTLTLYRC